jgi:hypothetical protein
LIAAGIALAVPTVRPEMADAVAALAVSVIIFGSLIPLIQGLIITAMQIWQLHHGGNPASLRCCKHGGLASFGEAPPTNDNGVTGNGTDIEHA